MSMPTGKQADRTASDEDSESTVLRCVRRFVAEMIGTFFLVFAAAGTDIIGELHPEQVPLAVRAVAPALVVGALIYGVGAISGAHLNPP